MLHVDFYEVIMTEKLTAEVPIVLVGQSPVVKGGNGLLFEGLDTIEIECLPGDLPPQVEVDISILTAIDQAVLVRDLNLGEGVDVLTQPDEIVVKILPPEKEEVEVAPPVEEVPEVEVVGKKKPEEEAPAAEAPPEEQSASATRQGKAQQERVVRTP